jgi:hypothetical protein
LHFAFEQSPAELNPTGRALLLNSIAYISQFTEDRPIARIPPVPAGRMVKIVIANSVFDLRFLRDYLTPATFAFVTKLDRVAAQAWWKENGAFVYPESSGLIAVDEEAKSFRIARETPEFLDRAIVDLSGSAEVSARARHLLARYAPEGPIQGSIEDWRSWWKENRPYLFYSAAGDYRWYIDPLAKQRGIPSADLRGPARATATVR